MAKSITLKERNTNEVLYPVTTIEQVKITLNSNLSDKIENIEELLRNSVDIDLITNTVINNIPYASNNQYGKIKIIEGNGLLISNGVLSFVGTTSGGEIITLPVENIVGLEDMINNLNSNTWEEIMG